jgi:membrane-associated phospholipid phosphatase
VRARRRGPELVLSLVLAIPLSGLPSPAAADTISRTGDVGAILIPAGAAVGALALHDHAGLRQLAEAYAISMATVYVLKVTVNRTRPNGGHQSFPSGHTASAFAGAAFLQRRYGWTVGVPACLAASFVGYSRVESHNHYTSDVVAGAAIAIGANLIFTRPRSHVSLALDAEDGGVGPELKISW